MFQKGAARQRVIHEEDTQNKDENPREFQRTAVQLHRKGTAGRVTSCSLVTDPINLRTHVRMGADIKLSHPVVPYVVCEPVVANATKCSTRSCATMGEKEWRRKRTLVMPPCWHAKLIAFILESRGIPVQDILNLAKERGGEWNDMIFTQATDRSPDAPDAYYFSPRSCRLLCFWQGFHRMVQVDLWPTIWGNRP